MRSTTRIAKELIGVAPNALFDYFIENEILTYDGESTKKILTDKGIEYGGRYVTNTTDNGKYIVWPDTLIDHINCKRLKKINESYNNKALYSTSQIANSLNIERYALFSYLNLQNIVKYDSSGYVLTKKGRDLGGVYFTGPTKNGIQSWIKWPYSIKKQVNLKYFTKVNTSVRCMEGSDYFTNDGHKVRSFPEVIIDNWLYHHDFIHAYEKKLPIDGNHATDFYLPKYNLYIEYWGKSDEQYLRDKDKKQEMYVEYEINLLSIEPEDMISIDCSLTKKFFEKGIHIK